ncbi:hypothetical protein BGI10_03195 [Snodgrassella alvi]|nr:hypothetical protein BGI07_08415 [Snodgrassella alvi]ORF32330.1 hypothetical protein BGI10_03195 [Snodgrassella alvi]
MIINEVLIKPVTGYKYILYYGQILTYIFYLIANSMTVLTLVKLRICIFGLFQSAIKIFLLTVYFFFTQNH